jgi:hypothetical protein
MAKMKYAALRTPDPERRWRKTFPWRRCLSLARWRILTAIPQKRVNGRILIPNLLKSCVMTNHRVALELALSMPVSSRSVFFMQLIFRIGIRRKFGLLYEMQRP